MKLVKLYKPACPPCERVENLLQDKGVVYESYNVQLSPEKASEFMVMGTPVTILLDDQDKEVKRSIGYNEEELVEMIEQL